ncbi:methylated-DNA--[protein]-cysteine S-methyltransferase [Gulosibacter macacae]|uniref:methylated-DNA--[protein]-cysteine S-methyltransferase n=1 Tax=Gulosibacter macacae TaxID=2488791 RepID=A0A3P3VYK7_9MICO|nr:methylated-DNA--[protein]-cysteine S-methyltransferase [Gulosibacter macacae]RRJ87892.1 methylated-DNA--[protein]-cysteine S-methyltransferase [Gulosibacter macacae]
MTGWRLVETRFGPIGLEATAAGLRQVWLPPTIPPDFATMPGEDADEAVLDTVETQLLEYCAGERREFDVPLDWSLVPCGFTGEALRGIAEIGFAEVESYGEIAARVGHPRAARAVGTACSKNPLPLVVPCHRVVRAGSMGSYGGGEAMKQALLEHEFAGAGIEIWPEWWRS